jgi:MFS family permease
MPYLLMSLYRVTRELSHVYAVALMFGFAYGGVMPLYAILVREYFGTRIMGTTFCAVGFASTLGMALGPLAKGWLYDAFGSYAWLFIRSCGIGVGAMAIACTFRPPRSLPTARPSPIVAD